MRWQRCSWPHFTSTLRSFTSVWWRCASWWPPLWSWAGKWCLASLASHTLIFPLHSLSLHWDPADFLHSLVSFRFLARGRSLRLELGRDCNGLRNVGAAGLYRHINAMVFYIQLIFMGSELTGQTNMISLILFTLYCLQSVGGWWSPRTATNWGTVCLIVRSPVAPCWQLRRRCCAKKVDVNKRFPNARKRLVVLNCCKWLFDYNLWNICQTCLSLMEVIVSDKQHSYQMETVITLWLNKFHIFNYHWH